MLCTDAGVFKALAGEGLGAEFRGGVNVGVVFATKPMRKLPSVPGIAVEDGVPRTLRNVINLVGLAGNGAWSLVERAFDVPDKGGEGSYGFRVQGAFDGFGALFLIVDPSFSCLVAEVLFTLGSSPIRFVLMFDVFHQCGYVHGIIGTVGKQMINELKLHVIMLISVG